jgi:Cu+-exporting ATPase
MKFSALLLLLPLILTGCSQAPADIQTVEIDVQGMTCEACVNSITTALTELPGVQSCEVSLDQHKTTVTLDANTLTPGQAAERINQLGFTAKPLAGRE